MVTAAESTETQFIPNAGISRVHITNLARRDQSLPRMKLQLRYEMQTRPVALCLYQAA